LPLESKKTLPVSARLGVVSVRKTTALRIGVADLRRRMGLAVMGPP
jgi:hypothetical protein